MTIDPFPIEAAEPLSQRGVAQEVEQMTSDLTGIVGTADKAALTVDDQLGKRAAI